MKYNFDEIIPRRNTNSVKWDLAQDDDVLPMWVADMDFRTAPSVIEAISKRVEQGIFGYTLTPQAYYDAIISWWDRRYHFRIEKEWILTATGVIPALAAIIKAFTDPGDKVLVQSPVYNHFFDTIANSNREVVCNNLIYKNSNYTIDFDDLEKKASDPQVKLLLLCQPHNPIGKVWTQEELLKTGEICLKHKVIVISDEIHCDLVYSDHKHLPFASLNSDFLQNSVTCTSPGKTFNLAGLQVGNIFVANKELRNKIQNRLNANEIGLISPFAVEALMAAYDHGEHWLEELKKYLYENYRYLNAFFEEHLPQFKVMPLQATYLVWIDCTVLNKQSATITAGLLNNEKLWVNSGTMYGANGEGFIRVNIACPRELLVKGLEKLKDGLR